MWWKKKKGKAQKKSGLSVVLPGVLHLGEGEENPLFRPLGGMPLLARTLETLNGMSLVGEIIVVVREADLMVVADLCKTFDLHRVRKIVTGEKPGLPALITGVFECEREASYIGIHDPLRPFLTEDVMAGVLKAAKQGSAAAPGVPVKDTIKVVVDNVVQHTPDRNSLNIVQTPQIVESSLLKAALIRAKESGGEAEDIPAALELLGLSLHLTLGREENIRVSKVTDIPVAETILAWRGYS